MIEFIKERETWRQALIEVGDHDFYHTYDYHHLNRKPEETAVLLRFRSAEALILIPLLLRPLPVNLGRPDLIDATSVYGYAGPLTRGEVSGAQYAFQAALNAALRDQGVVSVFSRLHPLMDHSVLLTDLGDVSLAGATVSIDLTLPLESQWAAYRKNTKYDISKLQRTGVECRELRWSEYGDVFVSIYEETMRRVSAGPNYFFPHSYYDQLFRLEGVGTHLFGCFQNGEILCAGLFTLCNGIIQYHLSGTRGAALAMGPSRMMLDTVRLWGAERGARVLHLGGGVNGQRDSLFKFKTGFSKQEHNFKLWKWVIDAPTYEDLSVKSGNSADSSFFPSYRS